MSNRSQIVPCHVDKLIKRIEHRNDKLKRIEHLCSLLKENPSTTIRAISHTNLAEFTTSNDRASQRHTSLQASNFGHR